MYTPNVTHGSLGLHANGISIGSAVFVGLTIVPKSYAETWDVGHL